MSYRYECKGEVSKWADLEAIYYTIVTRKPMCQMPDGDLLQVNKFRGDVRSVNYNGMRFLEQNKHTSSQFAARARQGANIIWVTDPQIRNGDNYLGYIENRQVYLKVTS